MGRPRGAPRRPGLDRAQPRHAAQQAAGLPSIGVQGLLVIRDALGALIDHLADMDVRERRKVPGIMTGRADVILAGAVVDAALREAARRPGGHRGGCARGVFVERLLADEPPLVNDVRHASVLNLAARHGAGGGTPSTPSASRLALGLRIDGPGDARVARWAAERETELFARAFGRGLAIETVDRRGHHRSALSDVLARHAGVAKVWAR